jgi:predicted phage tail protein
LQNIDSSGFEAEKVLERQAKNELTLNQSSLINSPENDAIALKRERLNQLATSSSLSTEMTIKNTESIPLNLTKILEDPESPQNISLQESDIIDIPKIRSTVRMRGKVLYPTTTKYIKSKSTRYYINRAGGFDKRAKKSKTYVVYANGEVAKTRNIIFLNVFPKVEPGSDIVIPSKPPKVPVSPNQLVTIASGLATIALVISQIN